MSPSSWPSRIIAFVLLIRAQSFGLNTDGLLLLSFKFNVVADPFAVLRSWNYRDESPCSWYGVTCAAPGSEDACVRVTGLSLPNAGLMGSISATVGMIEHLQNLNLSSNSINGPIPLSLFAASELRMLDLSSNSISGGLPELVGRLRNLWVLNLSGNALTGKLPVNLTALRNLTSISLQNNRFIGPIPGGFDSVQTLDLSLNSIYGPLPPDFRGGRISYLNISFNRLAGEISPAFSAEIPINATIDLSSNNLTGPIPVSDLFLNQDTTSFSNNPGLCGKPLENPCPGQPSAAAPPIYPPAIAIIPGTAAASPGGAATAAKAAQGKSGLKIRAILGIAIGDALAVVIVAMIVVYMKRRKPEVDGETETTSESSNSGDIENVGTNEKNEAALVTVDGEKELELETLLKASAYILGASGSTIVYRAVLEDGTQLAVRRVGETGVGRFRDFENRVRAIAKLSHPNLVRVRGFYWGADEKLIIYEFVPNGSLANARYRKAGSSPCHLAWEMRLKIAKGVARGLCYIHDKKHVHGNLKPTNILLALDMEPKIGDFGLERLVAAGDSSSKPGGSARNFGSKRSTASRDSLQDFGAGPGLSPSPSVIGVSPYHAPESLRSIKPSPKWDVFSFGVVLLELLTGKIITSDESGSGLGIGLSTSATCDDRARVMRMVDVAIRAEMEGNEDALLALLRLGYSCISHVPQKRPSMKEVVQGLDRFPTCSYYGHL